MKIKICLITLILLSFSLISKAQTSLTKSTLDATPVVKKEHVHTCSPTPTKVSKSSKDEIKRRNMAKYKAMNKAKRTANKNPRKRPKKAN